MSSAARKGGGHFVFVSSIERVGFLSFPNKRKAAVCFGEAHGRNGRSFVVGPASAQNLRLRGRGRFRLFTLGATGKTLAEVHCRRVEALWGAFFAAVVGDQRMAVGIRAGDFDCVADALEELLEGMCDVLKVRCKRHVGSELLDREVAREDIRGLLGDDEGLLQETLSEVSGFRQTANLIGSEVHEEREV